MTSLRREAIMAIVIAGCCAASQSSAGGEVVLVRDGKARCAIVVGPERSKSEAYILVSPGQAGSTPANELLDSAADLAGHLNEMAQIADAADQVRVVKAGEPVEAPCRILLGSVAVKEYGLEKEAAALPYPAYIYRAMGNDLLIFGSSPKGTANGIYGFMQDEFGVRWYGAHDLFRVIPQRRTIAAKAVDRRVIPSFPGRWFYVDGYRTNPEHRWARRRLRMTETVDNHEPFTNYSHSLYRILPAAVYAKDHPEYYPLREGKRLTPDLQDWSPCFSNPDIADIAARAARASFGADPLNQSFSLGINDTGSICQCDKCGARPEGWAFPGVPTHCDVYFHYFANEVARRMRVEFPDRYLGVIAYNDIASPPVEPVEPNVHVVITSDISEYFDPAYRSDEEKRIRAWEAKGCTLGLYFYLGQAALRPPYCPHLLAQEIKDKHKRGFRSMNAEGSTHGPLDGPMPYLVTQLWWNADLDVDALLKEYFATLYGPAAGPMSRLYDLFEEIHMRPRSSGFLYEYGKLNAFRPVTLADVVRMRALLEDARKAAPEGVVAQRIAYIVNGLEVPMTMMEAYGIAREQQKAAPITGKTAPARLDAVKRMLGILEGHNALYEKTVVSDNTLSALYTAPHDQCKAQRHQWRSLVVEAVGDSLAALYRWNSENKPGGEIGGQIQEVVDAYTTDDYHRAIFRIKSGRTQFGPNLVANPGFEEKTATGKHPAGPDWRAADPDGWSLWRYDTDKGLFDISEKEQHGGKYSARIAGADQGGCYIATIPNVKEGECYHAGVWVKSMTGVLDGVKSDVSLEIAWFDAKDAWTQAGANVKSRLAEAGQWTRLESLVQVPKGAATAVILLNVKGLAPQEAVFFDDMVFQKDAGGAAVADADLGPNMLPNGGFEEVWGIAPHTELPPARKPGFPFAWNGTPEEQGKGVMDVVETAPHGGQRAARMKGTGKNAYYLIPSEPLGAAPGAYLCEAWAKNLSASADTRVFMEIRWYNKDGWMWGKSYFNASLQEKGKWSRMEVVAKPPEGAIQMAFFLMADNLGPEDEVLFDDAMVRRIKEQ